MELRPTRFALMAVGAGLAPRSGPLGLLSTLNAGQAPEAQAWALRNPLAEWRPRGLIGTATLVGLGEGMAGTRTLTGLAVLKAGDHFDCWRLVNSDEVRPLPPGLLAWVTDETPNRPENDLEAEALYRVLLQAGQTSAAAFEKAARPDLTYSHLFNQPKKYRGEVVRVEGRLKGVRRHDAPQILREAGVPYVYEGMIAASDHGAKGFFVAFTELPPGVPLREKLDVPVSFAGYSFKKFRYAPAQANKPEQEQFVPMLIGRAVAVRPQAPEEDALAWAHHLMPWFVGGILATLLLVAGMVAWFRRGDRRVRRRLEAVRAGGFVEPAPDPVPLARPVRPENN